MFVLHTDRLPLVVNFVSADKLNLRGDVREPHHEVIALPGAKALGAAGVTVRDVPAPVVEIRRCVDDGSAAICVDVPTRMLGRFVVISAQWPTRLAHGSQGARSTAAWAFRVTQ
jgi:hypothetical protein